jgi:hypothetical protein
MTESELLDRVERLTAPMAPLAESLGLQPCDGGFRVKETETHLIAVVRMLFNWRVARTPKADLMTYDRGWCYAGTGPASFIAAVLAAMAWDGADETEPEGWNKNVQTGEWREPEG